MNWWILSAIANSVIAGAYLAMAFVIARSLTGSGQWRPNPLATATAAIFVTCAVHHGSHPAHMLLPSLGLEVEEGLATRSAFGSWHTIGWDLVGAAVALWYWSLRERFPALVRGAALFEDLKQRQRQALEINDNIVQGLAVVVYALDEGDSKRAHEAARLTLASSRRIIDDLLGQDDEPGRLSAGDLVRAQPATLDPPT